jgi:hypothetical protein
MIPFIWQSIASLLIYIGLAVFYSMRFSQAFAIHEPVLWCTITTLVVLLFFMIREIAEGRVSNRVLLGFGIAMALAAMAIRPFHSTDVYGYINRGWQQVHYGLNPYVYTVDNIRHWQTDPMLTNHWVNNPSPYGFIYLLIAKSLCFLGLITGASDKGALLWWFKGSNVLVHLATAYIVWRGVSFTATQLQKTIEAEDTSQPNAALPFDSIESKKHKFAWCSLNVLKECPPARQAQLTLALYLFNPLILFHEISNGHNDLWMGFFLTLAGYFAITANWVWLLPAVLASVLIKYGSVVLIPFALLLLIKQKQIKLGVLQGGFLALMIAALAGIPYLGDWQHFHLKEIGRNALVSHSSLHAFWFATWKILFKLFGHLTGEQRESVREGLSKLLTSSFGLFYIGFLVKRFRDLDYTAQKWIQDSVLILMILIGLISLKFYAWYIGIFLGLSLLLPISDWRKLFTWIFSLMQLMSLTIVGQSHMLNFLLMSAVPWVTVALPGLKLKKVSIAAITLSVLGGGIIVASLLGIRH